MPKKKKKRKGIIYETHYTENYNGCPIAIRRIGRYTWEYIIEVDHTLYADYFIITFKWWKFFKKFPYTDFEREQIINMINSVARATIDEVKKINKKKKED